MNPLRDATPSDRLYLLVWHLGSANEGHVVSLAGEQWKRWWKELNDWLNTVTVSRRQVNSQHAWFLTSDLSPDRILWALVNTGPYRAGDQAFILDLHSREILTTPEVGDNPLGLAAFLASSWESTRHTDEA